MAGARIESIRGRVEGDGLDRSSNWANRKQSSNEDGLRRMAFWKAWRLESSEGCASMKRSHNSMSSGMKSRERAKISREVLEGSRLTSFFQKKLQVGICSRAV